MASVCPRVQYFLSNAALRSVFVDRRELGATGLTVSRVLFGCGSIGGIGSSPSTRGKGLSRSEGLALISEAVEVGVNVLDTANSYAGGVSEEVIGTWLSRRPDADVLIATKVGNLVEPGQTAINLSAAHIAAQFEASRARLGRVDLYLSHGPDESTPIEETLDAFAAILESGQARAVGACNVDADQLRRALAASDRHGLPRYEWVQNEYNLLAREDEDGLLDVVREHNLGYTPYSPLAGGLLSGRYQRDAAPAAESRMALAAAAMRPLDDHTWAGLESLTAHARRRGVGIAALALAWAMNRPEVTAVLVAPRSATQFAAVQEALTMTLDADERTELAGCFGRI
jgi:aryl-alcohol dehydrogenase-like predicted oxidoreductase